MLRELCSHAFFYINKVTSTISAGFWTVFYFFYFLVKGKPEWKCGKLHPEAQKNCCVDCKPTNNDSNDSIYSNGRSAQTNGYSYHAYPTKNFFQRTWNTFKEYVYISWMYIKRFFSWLFHKLLRLFKALCSFIKKLFTSSVPTKSLPAATPKPFTSQSSCDSPSYNKVVFEPIDQYQDVLIEDYQPPEAMKTAPVAEPSGSFYSEKTYQPEQEQVQIVPEMRREPSVPPPAPPPPPAKPIRIGTSVEPEVKPVKRETKDVKGGVPSFPADVMAELSGMQKMREERGISAQRELTQSCHPDMPEWKNMEYDRTEKTPTRSAWRASSVGPTMRKLEQVVSRLDDSSDNEAQFVFRPKTHKEYQEDGYRMGRSVFTPLEEAEQMRETVNRASLYDSRPVTPACSLKSYGGESYYPGQRYNDNDEYNRNMEVRRRARTVGPASREPPRESYVPPPFTQSYAYSTAPFTAHTSRRSKTPTAFDRSNNFAYDRDTVTQGAVTNTVRQWPPASNATGAPVEKDLWFNNVIEEENDNGLITTMARRVVERKTEDNWKWTNDQGRIVDEQKERTWKGELDTVLRDGPNQGRHWSRTVELLPSGDTRFQDVSRQYDNNYVVESVIRNY